MKLSALKQFAKVERPEHSMLFVAALLLCLFGMNAAAQTTASISDALKLSKADQPPKIDGVLDADEWKSAAKAELNFQVSPNQDETPASEKTEAFLLYDREYLYVAFHCLDSDPSAVRAPVSKRDNIDADDFVTVFLDTYNDKQRAYYLSASAAGVEQDGIYTESGGADSKWDGIYEAKGKLTADGYIVEMAIPFKSLRFAAGKDAKWGIHLRRWIARKSERTSWRKVLRSNSSLLGQEGILNGLDEVYTGSTIDLIPTLTVSNTATREAVAAANPLEGRLHGVNRLDPGLTVIYSITPNATISATINPDFSQVEADVPQISVNQRFPVFFPEKRPFFLEGSEFFNTTSAAGFRLLDTRQIVDPDWGVKFTGKFGRNTISFLSASENSAGLRLDTDDKNFGKNAQFNIFRFQRDVLKDSQIGVFFTDRRFAGSSNTVIAGESRIRLKKVNTLSTQFVWSKTKTLSGAELRGYAHNIHLKHYSSHWHIFLHDEYVQPNFRAESGFIRRTDYHEMSADVGYEWRPKEAGSLSKWLVYIWGYAVANRSRTTGGKPEVSYYYPAAVDLQFRRGIDISYNYSINNEGFAGRVFNYHSQRLNWSVDSFKRVSFSGSFDWGDGINYDFADPILGKSFSTTQNITVRPTTRLSSEFLYLKSSLRDARLNEKFFNQDILRNRTAYQLTRFQAVRSIIDYDTSTSRLGLSLLYAFTPRPNSAVYVGYGDALFNGVDPLNFERRRGLVRQSRSLFAKFSYNFRF